MGYVTVGVISSLFHCKISLPCHSASELDAPSPIGLRGNLRQRQGTKRWWPGGGAEVRSAGRGRGHHRLSGALKSGTPKGCTIFLSFQRRTSALMEKGDLFHLLTPCDVYGRDPSYDGKRPLSRKNICEVTSTSGLDRWRSRAAMSFSISSRPMKPPLTSLSRTLLMKSRRIGRRSWPGG